MGWKSVLSLVLALPWVGFVLAQSSQTEQFDEELIVRPLRDGRVASRFSFTTLLEGAEPRDPQRLGSDDESQHYTLFPLTLGQILREYAVTELHLTLNAGKWDYDKWGVPDEPGVGTGAELWVWMVDNANAPVDRRWNDIRNALSGLFCASLGALDDQRTTSPVFSFTPEGQFPNRKQPHQLRHAFLPSEHVCTENLTPYLKLLPCKGLSGLARLLNPHKLFDADWHGMGVHASWNPHEGVKLRLTFQVVSDPLRSSPGNRRDHSDWSLASTFDRTIERTCPVASSSRVLVALPTDENFILQPQPTTRNGTYAIFNLAYSQLPLDVGMQWLEEPPAQYTLQYTPLAAISIQRRLSSPNQAYGKLTVVIKNNEPVEQKVIYLEEMPWLLQFYLHTLRIVCDGHPRHDLVSDISYVPAEPRSRPTKFQSTITLPANSTVELSITVIKSFLRYTEHPPDAQRGWDLPPAVFVPFSSIEGQTNGTSNDRLYNTFPDSQRRMYTPILLVDLATPDFSMPYNVIIFSCSLMAFIFGSVFNLLTRKLVVVSLSEEKK